DERRIEEFHLAYLVDKVDIHHTSPGQFFLYQRFKLLRFDAVATDPVPGPRPDVGQERPLAREGNGLEADPLSLPADLLGVEAGQAQITQPLVQAADEGGLAAAGRAGQKQVFTGLAHEPSFHFRPVTVPTNPSEARPRLPQPAVASTPLPAT